jgi:hypothetical protein
MMKKRSWKYNDYRIFRRHYHKKTDETKVVQSLYLSSFKEPRKESIPLVYVAWRAGTTNKVLEPAR